MMMQLTIRPVETADAGAIAAIYRPIVETTTISFEELAPDDAAMALRIGAIRELYPWLVAQDAQGAVCGYAYASRHRERAGYRYSVDVSAYVAETARGKGVGRALYERLFAQLRERGYHRAFAGIALPNAGSMALHRRCGFEPVGIYREVGYKFGKWIDVYWCQKGL